MKTIYNRFLPFPGFVAINLFGLLFVRREYKGSIGDIILNHEAIHTAQMKELGYILFYLLYLIEWVGRLIVKPSTAYRDISFEREAYDHQGDLKYLETRKHWAQWR